MPQIRIVLCPVDFSNLARQELTLATEVSAAFGARLVLHHNLAAVSPGFTRAWEWNEVHHADHVSRAKAEAYMRQLLADLPKTVSAEATISSGPLAPVVLELARQLPADLVVLGSHGWSTPDHTSVTERVIDRCTCPVLTIEEGGTTATPFRLFSAGSDESSRVVVATDLSAAGTHVLAYAYDLARSAPLELHVVHVLPSGADVPSAERAEQKLLATVPHELAERVQCYIERGDTIDAILDFSYGIDPAFMVMGEHARTFFQRVFSKDTARGVLHRATCPVWFVPAATV